MIEHDQEFQTLFEPSQYAYKKHSLTVTALIQVLDSLKLAVGQKQYSVATFIGSEGVRYYRSSYTPGKINAHITLMDLLILLTDNNTSCLMVSTLNCVPV